MGLSFEWDEEKATANLKKHDLAFEDAAFVFYDPARIDVHDDREGYGEDRFLTVGLAGVAVVVVVYTMRGEAIRLISARRAESHERTEYWKNR